MQWAVRELEARVGAAEAEPVTEAPLVNTLAFVSLHEQHMHLHVTPVPARAAEESPGVEDGASDQQEHGGGAEADPNNADRAPAPAAAESPPPTPRTGTATPPLRPGPKPPSELENQIAQYYEQSGKTQTEVAEILNKRYKSMLGDGKRYPLNQGKVSRIVKKVNRYRRAHGQTLIPTRRTGKVDPVDPHVADLGERRHKGIGLRQQGQRERDGD